MSSLFNLEGHSFLFEKNDCSVGSSSVFIKLEAMAALGLFSRKITSCLANCYWSYFTQIKHLLKQKKNSSNSLFFG